MQRYSAVSCSGGVSNSAVGGPSSRDTTRADSFALPGFSVNQRKQLQLIPYKLKCDSEPLSHSLGPPDYYPQSPNCPEETLTRDSLQHGYKETVEGLEESREISLTQIGTFTKPVVLKCKEAIRKRYRAINESRAQKRKAGQVYGVPLSGALLSKPFVFPEQRPSSEDFRKKWIEGLSQQHKRLRSLADHVPHGYRRRSLFEVLISQNVPLLKATWFIKITYLNQVRPGSTSVSPGAPDKTQLARSELWTKDVIEYLQYLLDEFGTKDVSFSSAQRREQSSPNTLLSGSVQNKGSDSASTALPDGEGPPIQFKWWYMVRILQSHNAERLLIPSHIIDWVLLQLQEKVSLDTFQLLLPIVFSIIESIALSQTYARSLVELAVRYIPEESLPGESNLVDGSRKAYISCALVEMLRYLIVAVPDTIVALDCVPIQPCVYLSDSANCNRSFSPSKVCEEAASRKAFCGGKERDTHSRFLSVDDVLSSIKKRSDNLAKAVSPGVQGHGVAKALQALDKALILGDVRGAYNVLFVEDLFDGGEGVGEGCGWIAAVSPSLRSSLTWFSSVSASLICSIFFLCEWATCDFRDCKTSSVSRDTKLSGTRDFSQVYLATLLLKMKNDNLCSTSRSVRCKTSSSSFETPTSNINNGNNKINTTTTNNNFSNSFAEGSRHLGKVSDGSAVVEDKFSTEKKSGSFYEGSSTDSSDCFQSPGPIHDILVCWIDQHSMEKSEGCKRLQLLITELILSGIFRPQAYVRQLLVSGIMNKSETPMDLDKQKCHYQVLKQLPGIALREAFEEAQCAFIPMSMETMSVYSSERHLILHGFLGGLSKNRANTDCASSTQKDNRTSGGSSSRNVKTKGNIAELKSAIINFMRFPNPSSTFRDIKADESQGYLKRPFKSVGDKADVAGGTPGCEDCRRAKRQKLGGERNSFPQASGSMNTALDDLDSWWVRKGLKSSMLEPLKVDPPPKMAKHPSRGRQKIVRKTQSLAQLAAARIEGSQGASTSHMCGTKVTCSRHRTGVEGEISKQTVGIPTDNCSTDLVNIGKAVKHLRLLEKKTITLWLINYVKQLFEGTEATGNKTGQGTLLSPVEDRISVPWKLSDDELSSILYLLDLSCDLISAVKFLLWLLPKVLTGANSMVYGGRNLTLLSKNIENQACEVGETFFLSSIRRYENVLVALDLVPDVLSATMLRFGTGTASNSREAGGSAAFIHYARNLLTKYGNVDSVARWEKHFKATCNHKLLSELESGRALDGEFGFLPATSAGVQDPDDYLRQKLSGRLSRAGPNMKEIVQRQVDEAVQYFNGKDRKLISAAIPKGSGVEKLDDGRQRAQKIVMGLMECIRQNSGSAQEGDPSLVASAVSAIVGNVGSAVAKMPDFTSSTNYPKFQSAISSLNCARYIVHLHITCLCMLKESLGERQTRAFEIALAAETFSVVTAAFAPMKAPRNQFQLSPDVHDSNTSPSNDILNSPVKVVVGRPAKAAAAVSSLVIGSIVRGAISLERMIALFRLREGLDVLQLIKSGKSSSNGISRTIGASKVDNSIEVYIHWFRVLVGNCRTISDGLVAELLGEPYIRALSRMQRMLPLSLAFPPAYSIFALVTWKPYIPINNIAAREEVQLSLAVAIGDAIRHQPFRDVCLRDTHAFYDLLASDVGDSEFAAILELQIPDKHLKTMAMVPLRGRLFLNAVLDCKMLQDDGTRVTSLQGEPNTYAENGKRLLDQLVHVLDTLQPAKFHWQWVELRLLLNEQVLIEKIEAPSSTSVVEAIRALSPNSDNFALSESENNFTEIVLTRLLVRPDAASLYSEVVHLLGRSLEESLLLHAKWFLAGHDVLFGRKSIRQRLINIAQLRGLSTKIQFWKPWGWSSCGAEHLSSRINKRKSVAASLEEGEVVQDGVERLSGNTSSQISDTEGFNSSQQYVTEKALVELVLPCIDRSSSDSHNTFASELIKQMNNIEQHVNALTRAVSKHTGSAPSGVEGSSNKSNSRKSIRGGSPGLGRRLAGAAAAAAAAVADSAPPSPAALRASIWLRLQFLLRLLPIIYADREPSNRNMRHMLASVILRFLGSRVVHADAIISFYSPATESSPAQAKWEVADTPVIEASAAATSDLSGESLFEWFLSVFHGLLGNCRPCWLKSEPSSKSTVKSSRDSVFDREAVESLQNDLDRMQLPETIRWRLQSAMPVLPSYLPHFISCQQPAVSSTAVAALQSSSISSSPCAGPLNQGSLNTSCHRNPAVGLVARSMINNTVTGKSKQPQSALLQQLDQQEMEVDPWTLLEDGTGSLLSGSTLSNSSSSSNYNSSSSNVVVAGGLLACGTAEQSPSSSLNNLKACSLLKGAVRVRRTELTYIGATDDDS